ncbi:MAG TPA: sugar ABC transporter substrate-binding protein [Acidobacteriota bacterium]|nr:sugar ABC transporter substrate-binding protein [Acidobacteriota bacterium]
MKKYPFIVTVIAVLLLALAWTACNRPDQQERGTRIALVLKTLNNPFFIDMQAGAQEAADRLGVELVVQAAERELDVEKQMQIVENLIQTDVDAICLTPSGSKEIVPAVVKANAAGIPVLILDTRLDQPTASSQGAQTAAFIGSDNYDGGRIAGRHLVELTGGKAKVAVLEGIPGHETGDSRLRGFREAIAGSQVEIVASQPANWERDQGFNVFQNMLQAHPEIDALFACNDMMALGAIEAIEAAGRTGQITVIGFDAVQDARQAMQEGKMQASVAQFPSQMGKLAVERAVALLRGEEIERDNSVPIQLVTP